MFIYFDGLQQADLPETRERRLLEHRLMQNYLFNMTSQFPIAPSRDWTRIFTRLMPELALKHDNLLYAILANSATHLLIREPENMELFSARQSYVIASMREQRRMVDTLSPATADPLCLASLMLLCHSFAALRDRPIEPYTPPMDWLHMGRGAGALIWMSVEAVYKAAQAEGISGILPGMEADSPNHVNAWLMTRNGTGITKDSAIIVMANSYPRFGMDESYFDASMRQGLEGVLTRSILSDDDWADSATCDAYERTLSYVGSIQHAIDSGEPVYVVCRRIQAFALVVPAKFLEFVELQRPRALVILAHFFATVSQVDTVWWLGDHSNDVEQHTAIREIRAITKTLSPEWQGLLIWPLDMIKTKTSGAS
jgi:hypothetical protein